MKVAVVATKAASQPWNVPRRVFLTQPQTLEVVEKGRFLISVLVDSC